MVTIPKSDWPPKRTQQEIIDEADAQLLDLAKMRLAEIQGETPEPITPAQSEADPTYTPDAQKAAYEELLKFFSDNPDDAEVTTISVDAFANPTAPTKEPSNG